MSVRSFRRTFFVPVVSTAFALVSFPAAAQVGDAERAAARGLFKQGDELQRSGRFAEALDRFVRAQEVYGAPTNELRIAECQAALGRLVESAEAYRAVGRTLLLPDAPTAFQAAVAQAKAELEQVEPRVPHFVVRVTAPDPVPDGVKLEIDGQSVPAALIGEALPFDPGAHRVSVSAPGYPAVEQEVVLKEREMRVVPFTLLSRLMVPSGRSDLPLVPPPDTPTASLGTMPPPPPFVVMDAPGKPRRSTTGVLLGAHVGGTAMAGLLPIEGGTVGSPQIAGGGVAFGIDAGLRFARRWYAGLTLEHANFTRGSLESAPFRDVSDVRAFSTLLGIVLGLAVNPEKASFFAEVGLGARWFAYRTVAKTDPSVATTSSALTPKDLNGGEVSLGAGIWVPVGRSVRLLPKATLGFGTFSPNTNGAPANPAHAFLVVGLTGFYNGDF